MVGQQGRLEISRERVKHNVGLIRKKISAGVKICATVKADAYGHGAREMAALLKEAGVEWLAVYSAMEVMEDFGELPVLVLAPMVLNDLLEEAEIAVYDGRNVRVNVTDEHTARLLAESMTNRDESAGTGVKVHIQVDTGLTRAGVEVEKAGALAELVAGLPGLTLEGMFAHFSHGDVPGHPAIREQVGRLCAVAAPIRKRVPALMVHAQNSAGVWYADPVGLDMVRVGIALYGLQPTMEHPVEGLLPVARVVAPVLAIHDREAGVGVGYGHLFVTKRRSRLAIVPVGYGDGYPRAMTGHGVVQVRGVDVPVVGRVSMDQIIVDVTDVQGVQPGEEVTVISWDPAKANCVDRIAQATGTIGYELATGFGSRLKRVIVD